jgi:hypothetical protein
MRKIIVVLKKLYIINYSGGNIMQLAAHEVFDLHELIMSCVNSITNMGMFINMAQD